MIRLNMVVEGQTEEEFVNSLLVDYLSQFNVFPSARSVETSRDRKIGRIYRGGLSDYEKAKRDLILWMKEDKKDDVYFTTMFDVFRLPQNWPKYNDARIIQNPYARASFLENAFAEDLQHPRFIPYLQLHEWEALILSDPSKFEIAFFNKETAIENLKNLCSGVQSPELINDREDKAPSKRIIKEIPEYGDRKASVGPLIAREIGLNTIRDKCPHFKEWLTKLETLNKK